jgi:hypothetical protein
MPDHLIVLTLIASVTIFERQIMNLLNMQRNFLQPSFLLYYEIQRFNQPKISVLWDTTRYDTIRYDARVDW